MAVENGLFTLAVRIQGIADEIKKLQELGSAADTVAAKMRTIGGKGQADASRIAFVKDFEKAFKSLSKSVGQLEGIFKRQEEAIARITGKYRETVEAARQLGAASGRAGAQAQASLRGTNREVKNFADLMNTAIGKIIRYRIAFGAWATVIDSIRRAADVTIDLNATVTELRKVMNPVITDFEFLANTAFLLGRRFGASVLDVAESMKVWAQQGNEMVAVAKLTEATLLGVNAAGLTATESVEALTSATKAYGIEAERATELVDKWLAIEARHAVTSQDLANAIKTVGAAAQVAGVNVDQLNGIVAAIGSVTRKTGREVANSFKTMLARLNRTVTAEAFQELGVIVRKSADELRPVPAILEDLRGVWGTLSKEQQSNIAITVGGIRRYTDFIVLMENFDEFLQATENSFNALGEAQLANQVVVESLDKRIQRIKTSFEELGNAFGEVIIGDALDSFAKSIESFADAIRSASPVVIGLVKGFVSLGAVVGGVYTSFLLSRGAIILVSRGFNFLAGTLGVASGGMTKFTAQTLLASKALAGLNTIQKATAVSVGILSGLTVAISALALAFNVFSDSAEGATENFQDFVDRSKSEAGRLKQITDQYSKQRDGLTKLISEKARLLEQFKQTPGAVDAEAAAEAELLKLYPELIEQYPELIAAQDGFTKKYNLSFERLATARQRYMEGFINADRIEKQLLQSKLDEFRTTYQGMQKSIKETAALREEFDRTDLGRARFVVDVQVGGPQGSSTRTQLTEQAESFKKQILSVFQDAKLSDPIRESVTTQINEAFDKLGDGKIDLIEFRNLVNNALSQIAEGANLLATETFDNIVKFENQLNEVNSRMPLVEDGFAAVTDRATKLSEELTKLRVSAGLFERDNRQLREVAVRTGDSFDYTARRVNFYRNQLNELFRLREEQELEITANEERLRLARQQDTTKKELDDLEERLSTLKRERDAVSAGYEAYRKRTKAVQESNNAEISKLVEIFQKNQGNAEIQEEIRRKYEERKKIAAELQVTAEQEYRNTLKNGGAYSKIVSEIIRVSSLQKEAIDAQIEYNRQIFFAEAGLRQIEFAYQNQIELANLRQVSEREVLELELAKIDALIKNKRESSDILREKDGEVKIEEEILKLLEKRGDVQNRLGLIASKNNILTQQSGLTLEIQKQSAVTDVLLSQLQSQGRNQYRLLQLQKERLFVEYQLEEAIREQVQLGTSDELVLKRRQELASRRLEIERDILIEIFKINEAYRASLSQVSSELSSTISGGIGGFIDRQISNYERLQEIQQELVDAERDRTIAIQEQNDEALYDANKRLQDLSDEQGRLTSLTYQWGQAFAEVGQQIASIANQKLAEQFIDSLFSIQFGDEANSLGQLVASGIVIKPALADFQLTAEQVGSIFGNAIAQSGSYMTSNFELTGTTVALTLGDTLRQGGDYIAAAIRGSIVAGVQTGGITPPTTAGGLGQLDFRTTGSLIQDANTLNFVPNIAEGGEQAGSSIQSAMEDAANTNKQAIMTAFQAGVALLANQIGAMLGGGGRGASIGSSLGGILGPLVLGTTLGPLGAIAGGLLGGLFDRPQRPDERPIFNATKNNPLPVSIEKFGEQETILHDVSINVEANFLDASQLDPIAIRNLALRVRQETEQLLRRENLWGRG